MNSFVLFLVLTAAVCCIQSNGNEVITESGEVKREHYPRLMRPAHERQELLDDSIELKDSTDKAVAEIDKFVNNPTLLLKKSTISNSIRLIFVAGVESTGHHAMNAMFSSCLQTNLCEIPNSLVKSIFSYQQDSIRGIFGSRDIANYDAALGRVYYELRKLISNSNNKQKVYFIPNIIKLKDNNEIVLSYPYVGLSNRRPFEHPDIIPLAILCESLSIDFRVIVLTRNTINILDSIETKNYKGQGDAKILTDNVAALYSQLSMLSRKFYYCVHFNELIQFSHEEKSQFVNFIHPTIDVSLMKSMFDQVKYTPKPIREMSKYDTYNTARLEVNMRMLNSLCANTELD